MVLKKRVDYGFSGFQVPAIPKAPRSRRRGHFKKTEVDGQACAFELLASLAGQLLQESESSASSNASEGNHHPAISQGAIELDRQDEVKPLKTEGIHQGSCAESIFKTEIASQNSSQKPLPQVKADHSLGHVSVKNNSDFWEKVEADVKTEIFEWDDKLRHYSNRFIEAPKKFRESSDGKIKNGFRREQEVGSSCFQGSTLADKCGLKDQLELYVSPALIDPKSNVKSPFHRKSFPSASYFSKHGNGTKLGFRDDDEKFLRCKKVCTKSKAFRSPRRIAHRRIRNLMSSKYWKVAPKLKECELSRSDLGASHYHKRKTCYGFERSHHNTIVKRRKFFDRASGVTSDGGFSSESVSNSPQKGMDGDNPSSSAKLHVPNDSHVKFSIKSLRIPELYIEVPETETVGSLKRTVMEAVMAILGGGVHVGVLVQGKKVRDDNRTLVQTGISCEENLDTLGFMLEPTSLLASPTVCFGDPSYQCETSQPTRSPETPVLDSGITDTLHDSSLLTNPGNLIESNRESTSSPPPDTIIDKVTPDSRALVAVPANTQALAVVPASQKTKRSEFVQRRTRRPFSVTEVEALVHAVEELGTGRWRDVKLRAFENADHRTYVDLKDKWKTLVHTATISPQQRRGEPVPQELLDRVLAAHAYWSQHQAKQHGKHQAAPATLKIREASAERPCVN
ncbi:telomere repeat-binding protein 3-like isoform X2 [Abrus precatorius]|uniref:Telomere repeat-binding protein 3-like isoform X2 n=1 Tax=Abrus precatorius TaxID=3816 RepID=A0A8B8JSM1_ABRPR|nr:telomere repeat-binding protein 3-like isoform X2 [Abrus precatorius]XP_027334516.1 telomere repeat-binding protein 3-like isoform X2 [Abrus precatorius]